MKNFKKALQIYNCNISLYLWYLGPKTWFLALMTGFYQAFYFHLYFNVLVDNWSIWIMHNI